MFFLTIIASIFLFFHLVKASYHLKKSFTKNGAFFENFEFFTGADPTKGYVNYMGREAATEAGLAKTLANGTVYLGVDSHTIMKSSGRPSVRLTSNDSFKYGLLMLDLIHMPDSVCGTWPAFWLLGSDWPTNGEIDIIEGVNIDSNNTMTLHTSSNCQMTQSDFSGTMVTSNCNVAAAGQPANAGCSIISDSNVSYGTKFNQQGGGIYAMEWTDSEINIWLFTRNGNLFPDMSCDNMDPTFWGKPTAQFKGDCNFNDYLGPQAVVFDTTFCGDWAGSVWKASSCAELASSCEQFVAENPSAFANTYWQIKTLNLYQ
ncbi:conserved hypothetical protein [Talaromyces stipitatus ATCC 10500]|uniref:endo-1,3(4)-beta-glucanase n=1 Tax=Talaromyces stipitatus (strain ATCC 10500 / CBS 375.48 / QM 6759 / NRRL 1006) TaxID=441959 RepID=B8MUG2_TALSN|nr:uncharacterized protein TSTA_109810 [Talaromyces stipitatus ATCC 10500]EED11801.1 conserved hypothetical protein [Talaromyces stipitatus ATCC 10500]